MMIFNEDVSVNKISYKYNKVANTQSHTTHTHNTLHTHKYSRRQWKCLEPSCNERKCYSCMYVQFTGK